MARNGIGTDPLRLLHSNGAILQIFQCRDSLLGVLPSRKASGRRPRGASSNLLVNSNEGEGWRGSELGLTRWVGRMAVDVFLGTPPVSTRKDRILVVRCKNVTADHGRSPPDSIAEKACPRRVLGLSSTVRSPRGQTRSARLSPTSVHIFPVAFLSPEPLWVPHPSSTSARPGSYI